MADAMHLQRLISEAEGLGADRAAPLPATAVVVDDRVNLKCRVPLCSGYGHNLMCPPHVMAADETRGVLRKYDDALVVQLDIPVTQDCVDEQLDGKTLRARPGRTPSRSRGCARARTASRTS